MSDWERWSRLDIISDVFMTKSLFLKIWSTNKLASFAIRYQGRYNHQINIRQSPPTLLHQSASDNLRHQSTSSNLCHQSSNQRWVHSINIRWLYHITSSFTGHLSTNHRLYCEACRADGTRDDRKVWSKNTCLPLWLAKEMVPVKFERALHARSNTKPKINLKGAPGFFPGLWALRSSDAQVFLIFFAD